MTSVTPDSIFQVASGFMASKHLYVANEVGLFEHIDAHHGEQKIKGVEYIDFDVVKT